MRLARAAIDFAVICAGTWALVRLMVAAAVSLQPGAFQ